MPRTRMPTFVAALLPAAALLLSVLVPPARGSDDNHRALNVSFQFENLKRYPEVMGFRVDANQPAFPLTYNTGWFSSAHIQGITRSPRPGTPHMYFSVSGSEGDTPKPGYITTVRLATRERSGERLRSNRIVRDLIPRYSYPNFFDAPVRRFNFDGTQGPGTPSRWGWRHPGNMVTMGDLLLTPLEDRLPSNSWSAQTALAIFDITDPGNPLPLSIHALNDAKAGTMAITRLASGHYLVVIGGTNNGRDLIAYRSTTTNLRDPATTFTEAFTWRSQDNDFGSGAPSWPGNGGGVACAGKDAHQAYAFVTEIGTGRLYLIGTAKVLSCGSPFGVGTDYAFLYEVTLGATSMSLTHRARVQFEMNNGLEGMIGNFVAGGGIYVSQAGTLLLYACPHGPGSAPTDGDNVVTPDIQAFAEIRPYHLNAMLNPGPGAGYLELHDDTNFGDRFIGLDTQDVALKNWNNLGSNSDFNDRTSSVRWAAPAGFNFQLYENSSRGVLLSTLTGVGVPSSISDYDPNDRVSSVGWTGALGTAVYASNAPCTGVFCFSLGTPGAPARSVAQAHGLVTGTVGEVLISPGSYNERVRLAAPAVYRANGGIVRIGQ